MGQSFTKLKLTEVSYDRNYIVLVNTILSAFMKLKRIEHLSHVTFLTTKFSRSTVASWNSLVTFVVANPFCRNLATRMHQQGFYAIYNPLANVASPTTIN